MGDRQQLQAGIAAYLTAVQADTTWRSPAEHAATIMRELVDPYITDSPVYRELAQVRAAANVQRDGLEAHIAVLQRLNDELRGRLERRLEAAA